MMNTITTIIAITIDVDKSGVLASREREVLASTTVQYIVIVDFYRKNTAKSLIANRCY